MEDIKRQFANEIAARLSGAPESDAKADMIEELAENLASRYADMTSGGMGEGEAFARALEELGDTEELTAYLNSLGPDEPLPGAEVLDGLDELVKAAGELGAAGVEAGKKAVDIAGQFLKSDAVRSAAAEGKSALRKMSELIKTLTGTDISGMDEVTITIDIDDDGNITGRADDTGEGRSIPSQGLTGLSVDVPGDVKILVDARPDGPVQIEGDMEKLDVFTAPDGTLTVRKKPTASSQFLSLRGMSWAEVSITVPARRWERVRISTVSGDVDLDGGLELGELAVHTASGDVECRVSACDKASFATASGDIEARGNFVSLRAETASGDVDLDGPLGEVTISTASGDIELSGSAARVKAGSMSGDICLKSMTQPQAMALSSKSGDVQAHIPATGPFKADLRSVSGETDMADFASWPGGGDGGQVPRYTLSSVSGDVALKKY